MKKNFVKKLALGLALVMAVTSVPASSKAAAAPGFKSSAVKVRVGQTKKYSTENAKKYSVKFKIGNKKVATIKYTAGSKSVKVTGVAEGKTTLRADFKSYKTKKVTTAKVPVTVLAAKEEAPVVVEAALAGLTQTTADTIRVTFSADASKKFTKDSFTVAAVDGSSVLSVKELTMAADGLSADLTVYHTFDDGTSYNVTCGGVTKAFVASVGEVSRIAIHTASAQENVKTAISYTLYDASGIDVTNNVDLDSYVVITITGSHSGADIDKASKAYLTMNGVGSTADVTITYNSNKVGAADVTATQTITCIDAKAVLGNKLFVEATGAKVNAKSECAKFYLGLSDSVVAVEENETTNDVYFCAKGTDGEVISYDSYSVESSNEDVMNVEVYGSTDSGKYSRFSVTGNNIGSAQINITAEKNGKVTKYTIPVTVTKVNEAVKMDVVVTRPTMSNVNDSEYAGAIIPTLYDAKGNEVNGTFEFDDTVTVTTVGTPLDVDAYGVVTAQNAVAKTYTVKVTGADNRTGKTFVKNVNITVKALPADADPVSGAGIKVTYQVELNENLVGATGAYKKATTSFDLTAGKEVSGALSTRLYATYNGLFAGYVRDNGSAITVAEGNVKVNADTALADADVLARFGNLVFNTASDLLGTGADVEDDYATTLESIGTTWMTYEFIEDKSGEGTIVYGDVVGGTGTNKNDKAYTEVARAGYYVLEYNLVYAKDTTKTVKKTQSFTIKDKVLLPTVKVESRNIVGSTDDSVIEVLNTNVDMNNNVSNHESILDVLAADGTDPVATSNGTKLTVKYAIVEDNYVSTWNFWVPVNTTFTVQ